MIVAPTFDGIALVSDDPLFLAGALSLFPRAETLVAVMDGPRMARPDAGNEVIRRVNALVSAGITRVVTANLGADQQHALSLAWGSEPLLKVDTVASMASTLSGRVKRRKAKLAWGTDNLGVGLYVARRSKRELLPGTGTSTAQTFVHAGNELLVVCEQGNEMAQVCAANLAFSCNASFVSIPGLTPDEHEEWLEDLYALSEGGDETRRFAEIRDRTRARLPTFPFQQFRQVLFVTERFPWGIGVPECATMHMYAYPDFGRAIVEGLWAAQTPTRSARNALLIDPQMVDGSEIKTIARALAKNGTLVRLTGGPTATVHRVQTLVDTLPFDIIVLSTHAGDAPGERATYEYTDTEGRNRIFTVDHAVGFGYDHAAEMFSVQQYERFHALDGVDLSNRKAKEQLYFGTAIESWVALGNGDLLERNKFKVHSEDIPRVVGSMALQMYDGVWIAMVQGFAPGAAPLVLNNACSSWHELSQRLTFAGARGYVGTLFPVTDVEAQEIGEKLFGAQLGKALPIALWEAQLATYGAHDRRPYVMVGTPWTVVSRNTVNSVHYMSRQYQRAIAEYAHKAASSGFADVKENSSRYESFLREDQADFIEGIKRGIDVSST